MAIYLTIENLVLYYLFYFHILFYILFIVYTYFEMFLKFFGRKKPLIYERITKTENISTVYYIEEPENEPSQVEKNDV